MNPMSGSWIMDRDGWGHEPYADALWIDKRRGSPTKGCRFLVTPPEDHPGRNASTQITAERFRFRDPHAKVVVKKHVEVRHLSATSPRPTPTPVACGRSAVSSDRRSFTSANT
jgi:hypothetical protein